VSDVLERLASVLAARYAIERELGRGGMAGSAERRYGGTGDGGFDG
jgi:hypothetical protein